LVILKIWSVNAKSMTEIPILRSSSCTNSRKRLLQLQHQTEHLLSQKYGWYWWEYYNCFSPFTLLACKSTKFTFRKKGYMDICISSKTTSFIVLFTFEIKIIKMGFKHLFKAKLNWSLYQRGGGFNLKFTVKSYRYNWRNRYWIFQLPKLLRRSTLYIRKTCYEALFRHMMSYLYVVCSKRNRSTFIHW
jgi:hypothetical protein